jgi:hypothetical protein
MASCMTCIRIAVLISEYVLQPTCTRFTRYLLTQKFNSIKKNTEDEPAYICAIYTNFNDQISTEFGRTAMHGRHKSLNC